MILVKDISQFKKRYGSVALTIGNFDGVHLGHQVLLERVISCGKTLGIPAGVLTFYPHPLKVLSPQKCPPFLSSFRDKRQIFNSFGIDILICLRFSENMRNKTAGKFLREILCEKLGIKVIVVGHDYSFGKNREGNKEFLEQAGKKFDFKVAEVRALKDSDGIIISSTRVRESLSRGDVEDAAFCLGRFYSVSGMVDFGDRKGCALGIKTAKVDVEERILPRKGVYIAKVKLRGESFPAVLNIGNQPTFGDYKTSLEIYILDFEKDIYHETVKVEFIKRLRDEKKFATVQELKDQIKQDVDSTRDFFKISRNT